MLCPWPAHLVSLEVSEGARVGVAATAASKESGQIAFLEVASGRDHA